MTIIEAIESGRPFKRPRWKDYIVVNLTIDETEATYHNFLWVGQLGRDFEIYFTSFDLLAIDWELRP